ncbi:hypothetical protein AVEN_27332-1 [Araneus ventricosus]|uniref:Uncharacterized protein n=1 Tax=Araneus ventricosus TaxID=182803 RepID=A0A4Y2GMY5_ARAVE|nr:hypothetical protein AVEN_27332-1 [Araneus ventricosus]
MELDGIFPPLQQQTSPQVHLMVSFPTRALGKKNCAPIRYVTKNMKSPKWRFRCPPDSYGKASWMDMAATHRQVTQNQSAANSIYRIQFSYAMASQCRLFTITLPAASYAPPPSWWLMPICRGGVISGVSTLHSQSKQSRPRPQSDITASVYDSKAREALEAQIT